jgi:predicted TIM-barrel fold metal-dependent hydrolase
MSVVDCHMLLGSGTGWWDLTHGGASKPPVHGTTRVKFEVSQVLEECSRAGIDRACVVSPVNDSYEAANRFIADACEKHPDKLIGIAAHSPHREEGKIARLLTTEIRSMGLKAVRSEGHPSRELLDTAGELGIPVIYAPVLEPMQGPARMFYMLSEYYPDIPLILPHMNGYCPDYIAAMETIHHARLMPNLYFDTSATMYVKYLERATRTVPIEKILFGSCGPHLDARVAVETIRLLELPPEQEAKVKGGNILSLLKMAR